MKDAITTAALAGWILEGCSMPSISPLASTISNTTVTLSGATSPDSTQSSLAMLATAILPLIGVLVGSFATYFIQSSFHHRDRKERTTVHIREAYANWAGAMLQLENATRNVLLFRESFPNVSLANVGPVEMHLIQSAKDKTETELEARLKEQATFCQVMLTDLDKTRLNEAQQIREYFNSFEIDQKIDIAITMNKFAEVDNTFKKLISTFLNNISISLNSV